MEPNTMSTSANSVRTLHRGPAEDERDRERQGVEQRAHCSTTAPPTVSTGTATNSTLAAATLMFNAGGPESITSSLVLPSPPDSPNLSPLHSAAHSPFLSSAESESSLPSVSSSFFFSSSAPGSPGRSRNASSYPGSYPHSEHEHEAGLEMRRTTSRREAHNLIIPSLALPSALRRPTPFGQTLGQLRLLVLGAQGAGKSFLTGLLLEDNEDVIEVGSWEDWDPDSELSSDTGEAGWCYGKVLNASTDWLEHKDAFGLERYEPTKNVQIVELPGYDSEAHPNELISRLKHIIERPFRSLHGVLHPNTAPSSTIAAMLASPTSPLYTAMVFLLPSSPTPLDMQIISSLSAYIPMIVLPRLQGAHREPTSSGSSSSASSPSFPSSYHYHALQSNTTSQPKLSSFTPTSAVTLRTGLFHSPETLSLLRKEGVDRFLKWREVEREVDAMEGSALSMERSGAVGDGRDSVLRKRRFGEREWGRTSFTAFPASGMPQLERYPSTSSSGSTHSNLDATLITNPGRGSGWSKAQWEVEWMADHSRDVDVARKLRRENTVRGRRDFRGRDSMVTERPKHLASSSVAFTAEYKCEPTQVLGTVESEESDTESKSEISPPTQAATPEEDQRPDSPVPDIPQPPPIAFDPLHLPSMIIFSVSLLGPLKSKVTRTLSGLMSVLGGINVLGVDLGAFGDTPGVKIALLGVGGFCVGVGVGILATRG